MRNITVKVSNDTYRDAHALATRSAILPYLGGRPMHLLQSLLPD